MIRFSDEIWCNEAPSQLVNELIQMIRVTLHSRIDEVESSSERVRHSDDEWLGNVGPAMSFEHRLRYEEYHIGKHTGLIVREVLEYYTTSNPDILSKRDCYTLILSHDWGDGVELRVHVGSSVQIRWVLPLHEHQPLSSAWNEFRKQHARDS